VSFPHEPGEVLFALIGRGSVGQGFRHDDYSVSEDRTRAE